MQITICLRVVLLALISTVFAAGCVFFAGVSGRRRSGMFIGAIAFPVASLVFGYLSVNCARAAVRAAQAGGQL